MIDMQHQIDELRYYKIQKHQQQNNYRSYHLSNNRRGSFHQADANNSLIGGALDETDFEEELREVLQGHRGRSSSLLNDRR